METALNRVREFHRRIGAPVADGAQLLACQRATAGALAGEMRGLLDLCQSQAVAGDVLVSRLPAARILDEVHRSNMTKAAGVSTAAGKGKKDAAFVPPDIERTLAR